MGEDGPRNRRFTRQKQAQKARRLFGGRASLCRVGGRCGVSAGRTGFPAMAGRAEELPRARSGLRQRKLSVSGPQSAERHRAPKPPRRRRARAGPRSRFSHRPAQHARHRAERIRRRTGPRDRVDWRAAMAFAARLRVQAQSGTGAAGAYRVPRRAARFCAGAVGRFGQPAPG